MRERPSSYGSGWVCGDPQDYDREYCVDLAQLSAFLCTTQTNAAESLDLGQDSPTRRKFLARLQGEISKRGVIDVLRKGVKDGPHHVELFYGTPSPGNPAAAERYAQNRFSVTRQLRYSRDETQRALDLGLFINGLPVFTFELKNSLTKQTVEDAVEQYKRDRAPREKLFELGRSVAHFAVDDHEVRFCTHLKGKTSWFLPFNQGWNDGAGNPPNADGLKTDYLWTRLLTRDGLTNILENYAQVVETKDEKTGKKRKVQIWPRYHQLDVVRRLLAGIRRHGAGKRYLIQHSAGSGKSNSIAWLAHQLIGLRKDDAGVFDSIIVVTDRRILDKQIRDTIKQFAQVGATVGHADRSGDLRRFIESGKKIIISTVQKFPFILDEIGNEQRGRRFAIVIDEAHSSQGGKTSAAVSMALSEEGAEKEDETTEDKINCIMESRKLLQNASYFAFTATPKNKTLEIFGEEYDAGGQTKHRPFHSYTMKQAIQEGFILDVLRHYTPVESYYKLIKKIEVDPEFDTKRARKKLRRYVESHEHAIRLKAEIMVDHFHEQVLALNKIGGKARAMVVTSGIERAIQYYHALRQYLLERKSPYRAIVAFSGEHEYGEVKVSEVSLNGFAGPDLRTDQGRTRRCQSQGETARPAQGGLGNIQARRQGARHPGAVGQECLQGLDRQDTGRLPLRPLPLHPDPQDRSRLTTRLGPPLCCISTTNVGATLKQRLPSDRPAAVQGAKRRSEPLTARTDLGIIQGEGKGDSRRSPEASETSPPRPRSGLGFSSSWGQRAAADSARQGPGCKLRAKQSHR